MSTTENHSHIHGDDSDRHDHGLSEFGYRQTLDRSIGKFASCRWCGRRC